MNSQRHKVNTWGLTLTPGTDCLNHLNTFVNYLGDLDDMKDCMKTTLYIQKRVTNSDLK